MTSVKNFRIVALIEGISFLILLAMSVVKHTGGSEVGVQILGPLHGVVFIAYIAMAWMIHEQLNWSNRTTAVVMFAGVVPFGGIAVDRWLGKSVVPATS